MTHLFGHEPGILFSHGAFHNAGVDLLLEACDLNNQQAGILKETNAMLHEIMVSEVELCKQSKRFKLMLLEYLRSLGCTPKEIQELTQIPRSTFHAWMHRQRKIRPLREKLAIVRTASVLGSIRKTAAMFNISRGSIYYWQNRYDGLCQKSTF